MIERGPSRDRDHGNKGEPNSFLSGGPMCCSNCKSDNPAGKRFCGDCGAALVKRCPKCSSENPPANRFCGECGTQLDESVKPRENGSAGERRHLTVLFCDLVGSTGLSAQLDPEEWRSILDRYHRSASEAIVRFGGHVAHYFGDGVMAYFGYPKAHDNDAERAARAGLAILDAITALGGGLKLSARVGIDSGPVVVAASAGNDTDVFGDTPNIAARVQAAGEPNTVLVTSHTYRLLSGLFAVENWGSQQLKGIERPLQLYRVLRPSGARGRLEAVATSHGLTPFVGREDELRILMDRWERARNGEGQVVTIIGEAGIGKSRLVHRFRELVATCSHTWLEGSAAPFFQNTPFHAVAEMLRESLKWEQRSAALEAWLENIAAIEHDALQPGPSLKLPSKSISAPSTLTSEEQRKQLLRTVVAWTVAAANAQPLIIVTEDLHWADPSTLDLIQLLVEQAATVKLLLLYTARPEFRVPWPLRAHHTQISLNRLAARDVRAMIKEVAARKGLVEQAVAAVVDRTGGVPLFVEELTRALLESGNAQPAARTIPVTLHDSLMARLDRLGPAKEVAQIAAVIGADFSYELLHAVHPVPEADLQHALRTLADAELVYVRGLAPDASYTFKHALVRDAAYEALLKSRRKEWHLRVARAIEEKFPPTKKAHPEVVAYHWIEAGDLGDSGKAIDYSILAGDAALQTFAYEEAASHWRAALALMEANDITDARRADLLRNLGVMTFNTSNYSEGIEYLEASLKVAAKLKDDRLAGLALTELGFARGGKGFGLHVNISLALEHFEKSQALLANKREPQTLANVYLGMARTAFAVQNTERGLHAARLVLSLSEQLQDDALWNLAAVQCANHLMVLGQHSEAAPLLLRVEQAALRIRDPEQSRGLLWSVGLQYMLMRDPLEARRIFLLAVQRPGISAHQRQHDSQFLALVEMFMGNLEEARELANRSAMTAQFRSQIAFRSGEFDAARQMQLEHLEYSRKVGDRWNECNALCHLLHVLFTIGDYEAAEAALAQTLQAYRPEHRYWEMRTRPQAALLALELGQYDDVMEHLDVCRLILKAGENWRGLEAFVQRAEGLAQAAGIGKLEDAEKALEKANSIFKRYSLPFEIADTFHLWGRALVKAGQHTRALEKLDTAVEFYGRHGAGPVWIDKVMDDRRRMLDSSK